MIDKNYKCKIVQIDATTNAFVAEEDEKEIFKISFPESIIRKFIEMDDFYILHFQCRSSIKKEFGNVCRIAKDGNIIWWAERKMNDDCYVELDIINNEIIAYDGSYNCHIDISTGKIKKRDFIK